MSLLFSDTIDATLSSDLLFCSDAEPSMFAFVAPQHLLSDFVLLSSLIIVKWSNIFYILHHLLQLLRKTGEFEKNQKQLFPEFQIQWKRRYMYVSNFSKLENRIKDIAGNWSTSGGGLVTKSRPTLATPWTVALQATLLMGFPRQEYWSGMPFPSAGVLPNPGIETEFLALQADYLLTELWAKDKYRQIRDEEIQAKKKKKKKEEIWRQKDSKCTWGLSFMLV